MPGLKPLIPRVFPNWMKSVLFFALAPSAWGAASGCVGFAAVDGDNSIGMSIFGGTNGGNGGTTVTATTQAQLVSDLGQSGAYYIQVQGLIPISPAGTMISVSSNKTVEGLGCGSGLLNGGFVIDGSSGAGVSNVILQNLVVEQTYVPGDPLGNCCNFNAFRIWHAPHHIWIDHCDLSHAEDGLCDITDQASYVTVSWCHLHDHYQTALIGSSDTKTNDVGYLKVTFHHDWFDHVVLSNPELRFGMVHLFDNYYSNVSQYCAWNTMAGQMVLENNNYGVSAINPYMIGTPTPTYQPQLSATGNIFDPTATGFTDTYGTPFNPATFYAYTLDSAAVVPTMALTGTGPCGYLTPTPTPAAAAATVWRIVAGGPSYVDTAGATWAADIQYLGGYSYAATTALSIAGTTDPTLYQTERYGNLFNQNSFSYSFPVPPGSYQVTLKLAETDFTGTGQRVFNVALNGVPVLSNFDIYADSGGGDKADDKVFNNVSPSGGQITVQFTGGGADSPKVNALAVVPQPPIPTPTPVLTATPTPTPPAPNGVPYVYSNPSSGPTVQFVYTMAENGTASIHVWNASGVIVASLQDPKPAGVQQSQLNIQSFAPGHYFYQVDLKYSSGREDRYNPEILAIQK